jgi:tRNA-dihydrouridine synthase B
MKIGTVDLASPYAIAPMAGMTDTAFRRLVKRQGGCGLVVTEMVSSEGLVRGIDRTLEYAEYTQEERPIAIQIFGGDPDKMAAAAQIVEGMGADIVDVNMGCPVPKIAKHNAGCSLMREPEHAAKVIAAMTKAVKIPVTVKMRAGWNDEQRNAPVLAKMVQDAGASAVAVHGRTAAQSYSGLADWDLVAEIADALTIPVLGSGDCVEPEQIVARMRAGVEGVLVGRGVLRNPWILAQAGDLAAGRAPRAVTLADRGRFLLEYIDLLLHERVDELRAASHDRWVINKLRALGSYYTKGLENGSHLRTAINTAESLARLRDTIVEFFAVSGGPAVSAAGRPGVAADPAAVRTTVPAAAPTNGPATAPTSVPVAVPTGVSAAVRPGVPAGVPTGVPAAVPSGVPTAIAAASH